MRHAILKISTDLFLDMLMGLTTGFRGRYEVLKGLPEDAKIVGANTTIWEPDTMYLKIGSKEFKDVPMGEILPEIDPPIIRTIPEPEVEQPDVNVVPPEPDIVKEG